MQILSLNKFYARRNKKKEEKPTSLCKLYKLQSGSSDQHPRGCAGGVGGEICKSVIRGGQFAPDMFPRKNWCLNSTILQLALQFCNLTRQDVATASRFYLLISTDLMTHLSTRWSMHENSASISLHLY